MMTRYLTRDRIAILAALAAPVAAAAILLPFRASWSNTNVVMLLVVVVVGVAAIGNRVAGGLAAVSAAAWFDFFFTLPYYRFTIRGSADITTAVLLLVVGVAVSQLAARARRLQVIAITDAGYLAQIQQTVSLTQTARSPDAVADHALCDGQQATVARLGPEGLRGLPGKQHRAPATVGSPGPGHKGRGPARC
jgi:K+-sensing histidine kinase KdpD